MNRYLQKRGETGKDAPLLEATIPTSRTAKAAWRSSRCASTSAPFKRYDAMGIPEYWIVDPDRETVKIYRRTSSGYQLAASADTISTPLIPGFSLPLRDIFEP